MHLYGSRIDTNNNPAVPCGGDTRVVVPVGATVRNEDGHSILSGRIDFAGRAEAAAGKLTFASHRDFVVTSRWSTALFDVAAGATIELAGMEFLGGGSRKIGAGLLGGSCQGGGQLHRHDGGAPE